MNLLYLAPHFDSRAPDGAGSRSICILICLKDLFDNLFLITRRSAEHVTGGKVTFFFPFLYRHSKGVAAFKALLLRNHYVQTKHFTLFSVISLYFFILFFGTRIFYLHFLWSYPFLRSFVKNRILIIDTHNYDPDWWDNLESTSKWPWEKYLCRISKQRILEILADLPKNTLLVHVSQEDADKYRTHRPDLTHLVLPNGCTMRPRTSAPFYSAPIKKIYFLGALNLQITRDAILHFDKTFWPQFSFYCEFHLIGSGPTAFWKPFCAERGWHLHNNVPDDDLTHLLEGMHYLVLPFTYGAGSKLKFIDACARGIPVISTPPGVCGFSNLPPTVRISEDPSVWAKWISSSQGPTQAETSACLDFAKEYSWDNLVAKVWPQIQNHPPVP